MADSGGGDAGASAREAHDHGGGRSRGRARGGKGSGRQGRSRAEGDADWRTVPRGDGEPRERPAADADSWQGWRGGDQGWRWSSSWQEEGGWGRNDGWSEGWQQRAAGDRGADAAGGAAPSGRRGGAEGRRGRGGGEPPASAARPRRRFIGPSMGGGGDSDAQVEAEVVEEAAPGSDKGRGRGAGSRADNGRGRGRDRQSAPDDSSKTVTEKLVDQLGRGSYDCMICIGNVSKGAPVWSCGKCWATFHLKCIHMWVKRSSDSKGPEYAFPCPGCRYHHVGPMPQYTCFCTKILEPEPSPHWLAHSCGEVCERDRGCKHRCPELCHPGPCPKCQAVGPPGRCHCGREESTTTKCGDPPRWSCGEACGKRLPCGEHFCAVRCHAGPCPPCSAKSLQPCFCGGTEEERLCGQEDFSCAKPCGMPLDCGEHECEHLCHAGDCPPCPRDPETWGDRCACGGTKRCSQEAAAALLVRWVGRRQKCTDPLPLCGSRCEGRHERCGHGCSRTCHEGPCGTCGRKVTVDCRCGKIQREVTCGENTEVLCAQVCKTKKTCGNHRCDVVCCPGMTDRNHEAHLCLQVCGKPLACGTHSCEDFCHLGRCPPCRMVSNEPLTCSCGFAAIDPPVVCGTRPPTCSRPCAAELACGHTCAAQCHFGEHPLCCELVSRLCVGGHREMKHQRCHIGAISCGRPCGRALACGHGCATSCHAGDCGECVQLCGAPRVHCSHRCEASCHAGTKCEDVPCRVKVKMACPCGLQVEERVCGAFSDNPRPRFAPPSCGASCGPGARPTPASAPSRPTRAWGPAVAETAETYATDLHQLGMQHRRYLQTLEDHFARALVGPVTLPPCDSSRCVLASEYARLHWRLKTLSKADSAEGWWRLRIEPPAAPPAAHAGAPPAAPPREPRPLLSELCAGSAAAAPHLSPPLGSQPRLRFTGLCGAGDEVYDLLGLEGVLGVRPGGRPGEVFAFLARAEAATAAARRLTGQAPGAEALPVRSAASAAAWGGAAAPGAGGVRVALELATGGGARGTGLSAGTGTRDGWSAEAEAPAASAAKAAPVPDSWEDEA